MTSTGPSEDHPEAITLGLHDASPPHLVDAMAKDVELELGWGRLIFGQTFADPATLAEALRREAPGRRDICIYARESHVVVAGAPAELFIDPSHTYRLRFADTSEEDESAPSPVGVTVRTLKDPSDADAMNRVFVRCGMVPAPVDVIWDNHLHQPAVTYLLAVRDDDGAVVGTVTGVDHELLFSDPERGSSLWTLAVDPGAGMPGIGIALTRKLAAHFRRAGRAYMDLSVTHDNSAAIRLYEKLGFRRVPVLAIKRKNAINTPLFSPPPETVDDLNPYARIIADEALRRGIWVEVLDAETGEMRLNHGGRSVITRESLSEFTSAIAMCRCDDKRLTRRLVAEAGITVPRARLATFDDDDYEFLREVGEVVVKPTRGEQGKGITVGVTVEHGPGELAAAVARAREQFPEVLIEQRVNGDDLRLVVIDGRVVAAALRLPPEIIGTGRAHRAGFDRGGESTPLGGDRRRVAHSARRGHRGNSRRIRLAIRRCVARKGSAARPSYRQPASGRDDPRCHHRRKPGAVPRRGDGCRGDRHPGDRHRPTRPRCHRRGVRLHRGQRATGPGQSRTTAHRCGFHRFPVSRSARSAVRLDSRGIAAQSR